MRSKKRKIPLTKTIEKRSYERNGCLIENLLIQNVKQALHQTYDNTQRKRMYRKNSQTHIHINPGR